ncbi:hypothetical protein DFH28DRAFT_881688 [Melampsora americana]|nr:hypothetical protein DFH28DRAFT_881688 [Melampsora americana]
MKSVWYVFTSLLLINPICLFVESGDLQKMVRDLVEQPGGDENTDLLTVTRLVGLELPSVSPRTKGLKDSERPVHVVTELPMRETKNGRILDCLTEIGHRMTEEDLDKRLEIREKFTITMRAFAKDHYTPEQMYHFTLSSPRGVITDDSYDPILRSTFQELVTTIQSSDRTRATDEGYFDDSKMVALLVNLALSANTWDNTLRENNWLEGLRRTMPKNPQNEGFTNRHWMGYANLMRTQRQGCKWWRLSRRIYLRFEKKNVEHLSRKLPEDIDIKKKRNDTYKIRRALWISESYWQFLKQSLERPDWKNQATKARWCLGNIEQKIHTFLESPATKKDFLETLQKFMKSNF